MKGGNFTFENKDTNLHSQILEAPVSVFKLRSCLLIVCCGFQTCNRRCSLQGRHHAKAGDNIQRRATQRCHKQHNDSVANISISGFSHMRFPV